MATFNNAPKLDPYQPGLEALRTAISRSTLSQTQVNDLLSHLDTKNYLFIAYSIAKNSLKPGAAEDVNQQAQNLGVILKHALDLSQEDLGLKSDVVPVAQENLKRLADNPKELTQLYQEFTNEFPEEQISDPSNYETIYGEPNRLLDYLADKIKVKVKIKVKEIWENFRASETGEAVEESLSAAPLATSTSTETVTAGELTVPTSITAGTVIGKTIASHLQPAPSSALTVAPTNLPGVSLPASAPGAVGGRVIGFAIPSNISDGVFYSAGKELFTHGMLKEVPIPAASKIFNTAAQSTFKYVEITEKGLRFASKLANAFNYISTSSGVVTFTAAGTTGGVATGTITGTIAGTTVGTVAGTGAGAAAGAAAGTGAGAAAGAAAGTGAGAAAGATAGSWSGPLAIITAIIGAILGFLSTLIPKHKDDIEAVFFGGGFLILSSLGGLPIGTAAVIGAGVGGFYRAARSGNISSRINNVFGVLFVTVVTSFLTPLVIIILAAPILIMLFAYIITNSAYVIPYNPTDVTTVVSGGPGGIPGPGPGPGTYPSPGPGTPRVSINPWPTPGTRPPPGLGSEYPHCWPLRGVINQIPDCEPGNDPRNSHCCYSAVGSTTCSQPSEPVWNAFDIDTTDGDSVFATHDGRACAYAMGPGGVDDGWGNIVIITSPVGFETYYGHLLGFAPYFQPPPNNCIPDIRAGELIGYADNTGNSSGSHLHYGITGGSLIRQVIPPEDQNIQYGQMPTGCVANSAPPINLCQWPNYCTNIPEDCILNNDIPSFTLSCGASMQVCCVHATPTPTPPTGHPQCFWILVQHHVLDNLKPLVLESVPGSVVLCLPVQTLPPHLHPPPGLPFSVIY